MYYILFLIYPLDLSLYIIRNTLTNTLTNAFTNTYTHTFTKHLRTPRTRAPRHRRRGVRECFSEGVRVGVRKGVRHGVCRCVRKGVRGYFLRISKNNIYIYIHNYPTEYSIYICIK